MINLQKYFAYRYDQQTDNRLHKYSYRGHVARVSKYIDDGINVYSRTPQMHETPLYLSIVGGHVEIVNLLLSVYEQDLNFIQQTVGFRPKIPILIGFGLDDVQIVQNLLNQYEQYETFSDSACSGSKCVVILLKRDNFTPIQVLCLSPQSDRGKLLTVQMIRRVIKNGVLDMNAATRNDDSLIKVVAAGGSCDLFYRLVNLGAEVSRIDEVVLTAIQFGRIEFLQDFKQKYKYKMYDMFEMDAFKSVFYRSHKWDIVEYVADQLVVEQKYTWPEIVNTLFPHAVLYNNLEIVENCLRYNPDLTTKTLDGSIPLHNLYLCDKSKHLVMQMLDIDPAQLTIRDTLGYTVLHKLANANRSAELLEIYDKYPDAKNIFFDQPDVGLMAVECMVARNHYKITKLVIENSVLNTELLYHILNKIVAGNNLELFEYVMSLRTYNFTLPPLEGEYHVLITSLQYQNTAMFHAIRSRIKFDLNQITTADHSNLLRFAIWAKRPIFNVQERCCNQNMSFDDSDIDSENEEILSRPKRIPSDSHDPYEITVRDLQLRDELNQIFDHLVENGVDYIESNAEGKHLIHYSVEGGNVYTTRRLLELGVKLNVYDEIGNLPIHYTRTIEVYKLLSTWTTYSYVNARNTINGKSLLHYLAEREAAPETINLIQYILEHGGDINGIDHLNRSPIYYATDLEIVKILLNFRPNLNMQDLNGDTPIHSAFVRSCNHIANLLLEQNSTDFTIVNKDGVSYLACFTNERNIGQDFTRQFPNIVTLRNSKFRSLLETHCNVFNEFGTPVFIEAIGTSELICDMLLEVANDLNIFVHHPVTKDTALHAAVRFGKFDLFDQLIARGLSIEERNANDDTCLHVCCEQVVDKFERVMVHRPQVNGKNRNGISPILYASSSDVNGDAICDLLMSGSDILDSDQNGQTAYGNLTNELKEIFMFLIN